jgi:hypothetical protein
MIYPWDQFPDDHSTWEACLKELADLRARLAEAEMERDAALKSERKLIDASQAHDCDYYEVKKERDSLRRENEELRKVADAASNWRAKRHIHREWDHRDGCPSCDSWKVLDMACAAWESKRDKA